MPTHEAADLTVRAWLLRALTARARRGAPTISDETPLADGGLCLDSIAILDLIAEMEASFGVTVVEEEFTDEHFGTVGRLVHFVEAKRAGGVQGGPRSALPHADA